MQKLFLIALVVGICTPAIMAQETAKDEIYGSPKNLIFNTLGMIKQDVPPNLRFDAPETSKQDVNIIPQAPKSTFFSDIPLETDRQYVNNLNFNSHDAAGKAGGPVQCPPRCPSDDYNRVEIYAGYSFFRRDFRVLGIVDDDIGDLDIIDFDLFDDDRFRRKFGMNGIDLSFTYNFARYVGAQIDFSTHRRSRDDFDFDFFDIDGGLDISGDLDRAKFRVTNLLFGIQVKNNLENGTWFRPFGNFLVGFSRERLSLDGLIITADFDGDGDLDTITFDDDDDLTFKRTSFALALGGGIDFRITDRFSIRAIKIDYLPVRTRRPVLFFDDPTLIDPDIDLFFLDFDDDRRRTLNNFRIGAGVVFTF